MAEPRMDVLDGDLREQRKTLTEQGQILAVLASSIGEIKLYMKESIEIQREQAVLFEKFSRHEEQNSGDHRSIHHRIDKAEASIDLMRLANAQTCDLVKPMAEKGARVHAGMVSIAKGLAVALGGTLVTMFYWLIQQGAAK